GSGPCVPNPAAPRRGPTQLMSCLHPSSIPRPRAAGYQLPRAFGNLRRPCAIERTRACERDGPAAAPPLVRRDRACADASTGRDVLQDSFGPTSLSARGGELRTGCGTKVAQPRLDSVLALPRV